MGAHSFGWAITQLKDGGRVSRAGWDDEDLTLCLVRGYENENELMVQPCIWSFTTEGPKQPDTTQPGAWQPGWLATQADMLANDWEYATYDDDEEQDSL